MMMESVKYNTSSVKVRKYYFFQSLVLAAAFSIHCTNCIVVSWCLLFPLAFRASQTSQLAFKSDAKDFCFQRNYLETKFHI